MRVIATRSFISTQHGNVSQGQVLDVDQGWAENHVKVGLVQIEELPKNEVKEEPKPFFNQPTMEKTSGAASQAAAVSQPKIAKGSKSGVSKPKKGK